MSTVACAPRAVALEGRAKREAGYRRQLYWCVLAALGLRLLFVIVVLPLLDARLGLGYAAQNYDADRYGDIANTILRGTYRDVDRAPVYTVFVAAIYALFQHSNLAVKIAQCAIDTGTVALIWILGQRFAPGQRTGGIAAFLYAVYPLAWWRCGFVDKEVIETFALAAAVSSLRMSGLRRSFVTGLLLGFANLVKPVLLGMPLVVGIWIWKRRTAARKPGPLLATLVLGTLLFVTPWTARNYLLTRQFIPVAVENGGLTAYVGNYPPSLGVWEGPHKAEWQAGIAKLAAEHAGASRAQMDGIYLRAAVDEVEANPVTALEMFGLKLWRFWFSNASGRLQLPVFGIQFVMLGLASVGLFRGQFTHDSKLLFALLIGYLWLVHAVIYAEVRFSLPAMPFVMLLSASGVLAVWARLQRVRSGPQKDSRQLQRAKPTATSSC